MNIPVDIEDMQWYLESTLLLCFLESNKNHIDMDKRYLQGSISNIVDKMPVGVQILIDTFMDSEEGKDWFQQVLTVAQASPYLGEDRLK